MSGSDDRHLGGFRILSSIRGGSGSQGAVYRAVCETSTLPGVAVGETVALKTMTVRDESNVQFEKVARRTATLVALKHPNIVRYKGCFAENGPFSSMHVIVMELLEGETLKERIAANPGGLDVDEAIRIVDAALAGLEAASSAGIVHRDVKPGNIFLCSDGSVKLIDFEISKKDGGSVSTASGRFAGTFDYMAPEFADPTFRGDARSDVFSMGVVFREALTGDVPYARAKEKGEQADFAFLSRWSQRQEGLCAIHVRSNVKRLLSGADVVLKKALAENAPERFATASEFRAAIRTIRFRELRSASHAYRLLRVIGRGGFGEVFKARIRGTSDYVAVKHLLKSTYGDRFRREARVMRQLDDPAFVRFVDYFETHHPGGEEAFLVMSFLPGMPGLSLRDAIKRHDQAPIPVRDVLVAFTRYARALAVMHRKGIFHRDIKPANLYFPPKNPLASAIMDLGIARDVNGTMTAGQVPGTLDYMPPEIVLGGSRGDAGMDIYALGLCLYEALTGKTSYPRLPTGPTAFAAFYERARSKRPPVFDDPVVSATPNLLSLLTDMTALDPAHRIHDAAALCRRIESLLSTPGSVPNVKPAPIRPVRNPLPSAGPKTVDTTPTGAGRSRSSIPSSRSREMPSRPPSRPSRDSSSALNLALKVLAGVLLLVVIALGVHRAWDPIKSKVDEFKKASEQRRLKAIEDERLLKEEELRRQEEERAEGVRQEACNEADEILRQFEGRSVTTLAAGNAAGEWMLKWRDNPDVAPIFAGQTNRFASAQAERAARDRREREETNRGKATRDAAEIEELCKGRGVSTGDCKIKADAWLRQWKPVLDGASYKDLAGRLARAIADRLERDKVDVRREAEEGQRFAALKQVAKEAITQADALVKKYRDETVSVAATRAEYAVWQNDWGKYRDETFFKESVSRIDAAMNERALVESGRAVTAECDKWLENIANVSSHNVKNWRSNLDRATLELKRAMGERRISEKDAAAVQRRIDACRSWSVGVIDNKTHRTVEFGGKSIAPISCGTVIFTNGVPEGVAVTSAGCEPLRVREDRFDSNTFVVLRMEERLGGTSARIPPFGKDVTCLVDGVERKPGDVELRQGRHQVVYRHTREPYPGTKDFKDQEYVFYTASGRTTDVPPPQSRWTTSPEFEAAAKNAGLIARGRDIVKACDMNLVAEPIETRRSRLDKAYGILNDWQTSSSLAVMGDGVARDLRSRYEAERQRVRGYVKNNTPYEVRVKTDIGDTPVAANGRGLITFEKKWMSDAYVQVPGYEFVMLPRTAEEFDGKEFVVNPAKLVPLPVDVTVPALEEGVRCSINGQDVTKSVSLRPGEYECIYSKADSVTQRMPFTVKLGEPFTLPKPKAWEPSGAMSLFSEAMSRFASGAVGEAKSITSQIGTIEDPAKRRELEDLKRAIEIRERLEAK